MATWNEKTSGVFNLVGGNKMYLKIRWCEDISGSNNNVTIQMIVRSWTINGNWTCNLTADGTSSQALVHIQHGTNSTMGESVVRTITKTINNKSSISVTAKILNMDYYDVNLGASSTRYYNPTFTTTIPITIPNSAPPTPNLSVKTSNPRVCRYVPATGYYVAEDRLPLELSQVTDPDGDTVNYRIYAQAWKPGDTEWRSMGNSLNIVRDNPTVRDVNLDLSAYPRGTWFRAWGCAYDSHGKFSSMTSTIDKIRKNCEPAYSSFINPVNSIYTNEQSITLEWRMPIPPTGTDSTQYMAYEVQVSKNGGVYGESITGSHYNTENGYYCYRTGYSISGDPDGTNYQFRIRSDNGMAYSGYSYSAVCYKNAAPSMPSQIFPNSGIYVGDVRLTWNRSVDPEGRGIEYDVYINDYKIVTTSDNSYMYRIEEWHEDGKEYRVSVEAVDQDGKRSGRAYASGSFYKASSPIAPSSLSTGSSTIYETSVPVSWSSMSSNGRGVNYILECNTNNTGWYEITNTTATSYEHNITSKQRGCRLQYRLKCRNSFGQQSDYAYSNVVYRNQIPQAVSILYPTNYCTLYNSRPRILLSTADSLDGEANNVIVKVNGAVYRQNSNSSNFSCGGYVTNRSNNIIFTPDNLNIGENVIEVYANDGHVDGPVNRTHINITYAPAECNKGEAVTKTLFDNILNAYNNVRKSYGFGAEQYPSAIASNSTMVKAPYINIFSRSYAELNSMINNFASGAYRNPSISEHRTGEIINNNSINQIISYIKTI